MRACLAALLLPLALPACSTEPAPVHVTGPEASREAWDAWRAELPEPAPYRARWEISVHIESPEELPEPLDMTLTGDVLYGGDGLARFGGTGTLVDAGEELPFTFAVILTDGRAHLYAHAAAGADAAAEEIAGSVSLEQLGALQKQLPDLYAQMGIPMPDYAMEMLELPVSSWFHPVIYFGGAMQGLAFRSFDRAEGRVQVKAGVDVEQMRATMESVLEEAPEPGMDEVMEGMMEVFGELEFDLAFDDRTGFPEPTELVVDVPAGRIDPEQPAVHVAFGYALREVEHAPAFGADAFALPEGVTFEDYDFVLAMMASVMGSAIQPGADDEDL